MFSERSWKLTLLSGWHVPNKKYIQTWYYKHRPNNNRRRGLLWEMLAFKRDTNRWCTTSTSTSYVQLTVSSVICPCSPRGVLPVWPSRTITFGAPKPISSDTVVGFERNFGANYIFRRAGAITPDASPFFLRLVDAARQKNVFWAVWPTRDDVCLREPATSWLGHFSGSGVRGAAIRTFVSELLLCT